MIKYTFSAVLICLVLFSSVVFAEAPSAQCPVIKAESAPVIDGKLNDPIWKTAPRSPNFTDNTGKIPAKPGAYFRSVTDGKFLYIAIELMDPDSSKLSRKNLGKDKLEWSEDVEVFLAPAADQPEYYHFGVDPAGSDADCKGLGNPIDFGCSWKHKETINAKGWITEMALPLTELGRAQGVKTGDMLGFNICRSTKGFVPLQCWSPSFGGFNNRDAFGTLIIGGFKAAAVNQLGLVSDHFKSLKKQASVIPAIKDRLVQISLEFAGLQTRTSRITNLGDWNRFKSDCAKLDSKMSLTALVGRDLMIWTVNPWALPWADTLPSPETKTVDSITINAFQGEYITRAVAITNATDDTASFRCIATDLVTQKWNKQAPVLKHLKLYEAQEVALRGGGKQRDPLPELRIESVVNLSPGRNSVMWVTLDTNGLEPGQWLSTIVVKPTVRVELQKKIRVTINVLPAEFPKGPEPYSCNWANYGQPTCDKYPEACYEDQKQHLTNVHILDWVTVGSVKFGPDGKPANDPDFSNIDKYVSIFGKDQVYVITSVYEWLPRELGGGGSWTDKEQANFTWLVKLVRKHFEEKGVGVHNFAWYPKDEPCSVEDGTFVANFGKLLKAADPEQQIFTTVFNRVEMKALEIMAPYVNLWVPSMWLAEEQTNLIKKQKVRLFSYSVLGRDSGPYWHYRLDAWRALDRGYEGIGFWDYNDCGGSKGASVWDDNDGDKSDYSIIYEGNDKPISSVRWEAWRQGIQDYRMVKWLTSLAGSNKALPTEAVSSVLKDNKPATADTYYEKMRDEVIKSLVLSGSIPSSSLTATRPLVCLTGNGGDNVENADTGGFYTFSKFPDEMYGERCGAKDVVIYFQGKNAKSGIQAQNHYDGLITDGLLSYPSNYVICSWAPRTWTTTFDLQKSYTLSHVLVYVDSKGIIASISDTGKDGSWEKVSEIPNIETGQKSFDGAALLDLGGKKARFVKLDMQTEGQTVRFGECRIFGWK